MARTFSLLELRVSKSSVNCLVSAALKCFLTCDVLWGFPTSSCLTFLPTLNPPTCSCCYCYCCLVVVVVAAVVVVVVCLCPVSQLHSLSHTSHALTAVRFSFGRKW